MVSVSDSGSTSVAGSLKIDCLRRNNIDAYLLFNTENIPYMH